MIIQVPEVPKVGHVSTRVQPVLALQLLLEYGWVHVCGWIKAGLERLVPEDQGPLLAWSWQ